MPNWMPNPREHGLVEFGAPFAARNCFEDDCLVNVTARISPFGSVAGIGHPRCICGVVGPHLTSLRPRRKWMDHHIADVVLGEAIMADEEDAA